MNRLLPPNPSLDWLKHRAKDLLKAHREGRPDACEVLRRLHRFQAASDSAILSAKTTLHDVQLATALDYGFPSWNDLKRHVEAKGAPAFPASKSDQPARVRTEGNRVWIEGVPKLAWGRSGSCTYAGALEAALSLTSHPFSYYTPEKLMEF